MRESNSRNWSHNPAPQPFGQSRHRKLELLAGFPPASTCLQGRCLCMSATAAKLLELARSLELRSGAYRAPALPVELYQRSWRGDSNAAHGLTGPALFPLSYASTTSSKKIWSGRRDSNPRFRHWQCRVLAARRLPHLERAARVELASSAWKAEAPAVIPCSLLAGDEGLEPSYLDLEARVLAAGRISRNIFWRS